MVFGRNELQDGWFPASRVLWSTPSNSPVLSAVQQDEATQQQLFGAPTNEEAQPAPDLIRHPTNSSGSGGPEFLSKPHTIEHTNDSSTLPDPFNPQFQQNSIDAAPPLVNLSNQSDQQNNPLDTPSFGNSDEANPAVGDEQINGEKKEKMFWEESSQSEPQQNNDVALI